MATLTERVTAALADLDAQIAYIQAKAAAEVTALQTRRTALVEAQKIITPQIEAAVVGLKQTGLDI